MTPATSALIYITSIARATTAVSAGQRWIKPTNVKLLVPDGGIERRRFYLGPSKWMVLRNVLKLFPFEYI